jgi:long-subunit acyl-CoA synthetase (AMP-forming)
VITDEWTPGGPDLTATMKMRRRNVLNRYADIIDELYR